MLSGCLLSSNLAVAQKIATSRLRPKAKPKQPFYEFIGVCGELAVLQTFTGFVSPNIVGTGGDGGIDARFIWDETFDVKTTTETRNPHLILQDTYRFVANYLILVQLHGISETDFTNKESIHYTILGWTDEDIFKKFAKRRPKSPGTQWMRSKLLSPPQIILEKCFDIVTSQ